MSEYRKIIHIDMDAFYASVEELDQPEIKGKPVVVGGNPKSRGVVSAANYEARKYGIHSAMATFMAYKKCPEAVFLYPRFERYKEISAGIREIFKKVTPCFEPLSLDEAWLDVTPSQKESGRTATETALWIKQQIFEKFGLTCSAGVSYNKMLAKIASKQNKPNGIFVIRPGEAQKFLTDKPVMILPFVGKKTMEKMTAMNIRKCCDIVNLGPDFMSEHFGKSGRFFYLSALGINDSPVVPHSIPKSVSSETTLEKNLYWGKEAEAVISKLAISVFNRYQKTGLYSRHLSVKIKFYDFHQITRSILPDKEPKDSDELEKLASERIRYAMTVEFPMKSVRLLGLGFDNLKKFGEADDLVQPNLPGMEE